MNVRREPLSNAVAIHTATKRIERAENQLFYKTPKGIELWQEEPVLIRIKRWGREVLWVEER